MPDTIDNDITQLIADVALANLIIRGTTTIPPSTGAELVAALSAIIATQANSLAAGSGGTLIGFQQAPGNTVIGTVDSKLKQFVTVNDFVTGGSGTSVSPWVGWDTRIIWSANTQYEFLDGYYAYTTSPNFAKDSLRLNGRKGTVLRHTGTGYALLCDAGSVSEIVAGMDIRNITLESNATATGGVFMRACCHSNFDINFRNIPGICFSDISGVLNTYKLKHTAQGNTITITPATLLACTKRGAGIECSANEYQLIGENLSGTALVLTDCVNSRFNGGTLELNGFGMSISATSNYNVFNNTQMFGNADLDINCLGTANVFNGVRSSREATFVGTRNVCNGGVYDRINNSGISNTFNNVVYGQNRGLFNDNEITTIKRSVYNAYTATLDHDRLGVVRDFTASGKATFGKGVAVWGDAQMTKTANGELLIGISTLTGNGKLQVNNSTNTATDQNIRSMLGGTAYIATAQHIYCNTGGTDVMLVLGNGNLQNVNNSYGAISDIKLKENIVPATPKLDKIMQVNVVNYNLINDPNKEKQLGVIAQELAQIFPGMVQETNDHDEHGELNGEVTKGVKYSVFVPMLIQCVQEMNQKIKVLEDKLNAKG